MSKLRIAIDGNEANIIQRVGSNAYAYEILCALEKITAARSEIEVTVLLTHQPHEEMPAARPGWQYYTFGPSALWTQIALPIHLFTHRKEYDIFYTPGHYAPRISSVPYVSSVMDLAFLYFPKQFRRKDFLQLKEWTRYSVKHAQRIITISEHTKQDLVKNYHLKPQKIAVAYPAIDLETLPKWKDKERLETFKKYHVHEPYILYVGTLQPRKNLIRLVEAFEDLVHSPQTPVKERGSRYNFFGTDKLNSLQLVIVGKKGWLAESLLEKIATSPLKNRIILTGFVTEKEKAIFYKNSLCTVLIGLYEGFGIPALEAMAFGSIPVVSGTTSLPEVVGEAGVRVDPKSTVEIVGAMQHIIELPAKERGRLLKNGRQQLKKFSWEHSARSILETLEEVVENAAQNKS